MKSRTLINADRVICLTEATPSHYETICRYIEGTERTLTKCFGGLYSALMEDMIDYSTENNYKGRHNDATAYQAGDVVYYKGRHYRALKSNKEVEPGCTDDWKPLKVFEDDCNNKLWEEASLERYLADGVYQDVLPFLHIDLTAIGLQTPDDKSGGSSSAQKYFFGLYEGKLKERMQDSLDLVYDWLKDQKKGGCDFKLGDDCGCSEAGSSFSSINNHPRVLSDRVSW